MQCSKTKIMEKEKQLFIIFFASYVDLENLYWEISYNLSLGKTVDKVIIFIINALDFEKENVDDKKYKLFSLRLGKSGSKDIEGLNTNRQLTNSWNLWRPDLGSLFKAVLHGCESELQANFSAFTAALSLWRCQC